MYFNRYASNRSQLTTYNDNKPKPKAGVMAERNSSASFQAESLRDFHTKMSKASLVDREDQEQYFKYISSLNGQRKKQFVHGSQIDLYKRNDKCKAVTARSGLSN